MSHTPTPWKVSGGDIWPESGNPAVKIAEIVKPSAMNGIDWKSNAEFITRACNCHDDLVNCLLLIANDCHGDAALMVTVARAALKKAEAA
jgi:hypothetical protein